MTDLYDEQDCFPHICTRCGKVPCGCDVPDIWATPMNDLGGTYSAKLQQPNKDAMAYTLKSTADARIAELEARLKLWEPSTEVGLGATLKSDTGETQ